MSLDCSIMSRSSRSDPLSEAKHCRSLMAALAPLQLGEIVEKTVKDFRRDSLRGFKSPPGQIVASVRSPLPPRHR